MENTSRLYDTLVQMLGQHRNWLDVRHLKTLAWMMVGLIQSGCISLSEWTPYVISRARYAQSIQRRFVRWLNNPRIGVHRLYGPLIRQALAEWGEEVLYLALDTSQLWGRYCLIRISVIYRGRAIPLAWKVIAHASSAVGFADYRDVIVQAAELVPPHVRVVFLADRGFADTELMAFLTQECGWHWRIRVKESFWLYRRGRRRCKIGRITLAPGQARFWHHVLITEQRFGPVHLAIARPHGTKERWVVLSDEPTDWHTLDEYGLRFDIEEGFLDDKSNGFQLESTQIDNPEALTRLCFVLAITTLYLVAQGVEVVAQGKRRWIDPHWFRGHSYLKIGWKWVKRALVMGWDLLIYPRLPGGPDPEPAMASKQQVFRQPALQLSVSFESFV